MLEIFKIEFIDMILLNNNNVFYYDFKLRFLQDF